MKIISFYTSHYEVDAKELIKTIEQFDIPYEVEYRKRIGSWAANTQIKAPFILEKLKQNESVVWTDADSRIMKYPTLFDNIDTDVGLFFLPREKSGRFTLPPGCVLDNSIVDQNGFLQSGTMYFKNTPRTIELLEMWVETNNNDNQQWDQWTLQACLSKIDGLTITKLPPEYVWIDSISINEYGNLSPVVYHTQASRRFKKVIH